jgi:hypothetical protein
VVEQPIRNRQVASSTLALGSTFLLKIKELEISVWPSLARRCMDVAYFEFFT